ncbi:hypothetical protein AJR26_013075 [Shigella flexneri]|nr:hypothetical protein AJR26_013075 [Shigella flexneri]OUZ81682.1 hypothetical protein CBW45_08735 [Shigella flexneri]OUZ85505.1 hypothetical protein CBL22_13150 [Shigella flexneri]
MKKKVHLKSPLNALRADEKCRPALFRHFREWVRLKWHTEFGHLNRGDMLTSEQHRCSNEKKKF